jgi:hypothetical protein
MNISRGFSQSLKNIVKKMVGESRFELPTSCAQGRRANQAALLPEPLYRHSYHKNSSKTTEKRLY